jgi:hypothetical protein
VTVQKTQIARIKAKLERDGYVARNECLRQFPAITRLGARIEDLEQKHGCVFTTKDTDRDYVYRLVSINGEPVQRLTREQHLQIAKDAVATFDAA